MSYNDDKRELLKLKQGLIEESETIHEEEKRPEKYEIHGCKAKVSNFFYHYKWHVIVIAFFAAVLSFLVISTVTKEKKDIRILLTSDVSEISTSLYFRTDKFELALEQFCPDFDKNGNVHAEIYYIDMVKDTNTADYHLSNQAKLYGEISIATAHMYIGNMGLLKEIAGENDVSGVFMDLSALYPEDENVVDKYFYRVKNSALADAAGYVETCPEDLYIVIRSDFEGMSSYGDKERLLNQQALEVLDNIVKANKVNEPKQ